MNYLKLTGLALSILLCCGSVSAQDKSPLNEPDLNKPRLFASMPDRIAVDVNDLKSLVESDHATGRDASLRLSDTKISAFRGRIVSTASKYENKVRSVVLKSSDFNGASFTISSVKNADGTITYSGRIISFQHADMYVLEHSNGRYTLVKKNFYELVNE